jgi:hypothetical protein
MGSLKCVECGPGTFNKNSSLRVLSSVFLAMKEVILMKKEQRLAEFVLRTSIVQGKHRLFRCKDQ